MEKKAALKLCEAVGEKVGRGDACEGTLIEFMRFFLVARGFVQCKAIGSGGFGCTFSGTYDGK